MSARYLAHDPGHPGLDQQTTATVARYLALQPVVAIRDEVAIGLRGQVYRTRCRYLSDGVFVWSEQAPMALLMGAVPEVDFLDHLRSALPADPADDEAISRVVDQAPAHRMIRVF